MVEQVQICTTLYENILLTTINNIYTINNKGHTHGFCPPIVNIRAIEYTAVMSGHTKW